MSKMTLRQLEVFVAAARNLSFARTAEELFLSTPAVSMQIKQLESTLGLPLFNRSSGRVELTTSGQYMLVHARRMLSSAKEMSDLAARIQQVETGRLTLGMLGTAKYFIPHMLAPFLEQHPGVELKLNEGNRTELFESLERGDIDLAVMGRPPREHLTIAEPFAAHPLGVVAHTEHPLAQSSAPIPPQKLATENFITREAGSGTRYAMEEWFRESHIDPPIIMRMSSNETIKQAVSSGMGLAFLSLHTVALELQQGYLTILPIDGLPFMRQWHMVYIHTRVLSPAADALRHHISEFGSRFLEEHFPNHLLQAQARNLP